MTTKPELTTVEKAALKKKRRRYAMIIGIALALACKSLPPDYQQVCKVVLSACNGSF